MKAMGQQNNVQPSSVPPPRGAVLRCRDLCKFYQQGDERLPVLQDIELAIETAERVAIIGASGSGKTTLLNMLGGLDVPDSGGVEVAGKFLASLDDRELSALRNTSLGFVYQFHHLLPEFTALENVAMPLLIAGARRAGATSVAQGFLESVGMSHRLRHRPAQLSGGERQRVAIARALVQKPSCVLMDEPTGNLDEQATRVVLDLFEQLSEQFSTAFLLVTHDPQVAGAMQRVLELKQGRLVPVMGG